jgi:hypothetical protein
LVSLRSISVLMPDTALDDPAEIVIFRGYSSSWMSAERSAGD